MSVAIHLCPRRLLGSLVTLWVAGIASAGEIPAAPVFTFEVPTPNADYLVQSVQSPQSPHYFPPLKILSAASALDNDAVPVFGHPSGYHAGYIGRGFRQPYFSSGDRLVQFYDCSTPDISDSDCDNGFATLGRILMPVSVYDNKSNACIRAVLGHELFHHIQFAYADAAGASGCSGWIGGAACEGQARSLQDKIYIDLDLDPEASCVAGYLGQVDNYLQSPNQNLWNSKYDAALWWTYLSEQYGTTAVEPHRGIDFLVRWWQLAEDEGEFPDPLAVTDTAIKEFQPTHSARAAFHNFIIANIAKDLDLSNASDAFRNRYSYRDEEPLFLLDNQMQYREVPRSNLVVPIDGMREIDYSVTNHGAAYQEWDVSYCPSGRVIRFETEPQQNLFGQGYYTITGLVTVRGDAPGVPVGLYKNRSRGWSVDIVQPFDRLDRLLSVVAGWSSFSFGQLRVSCIPQPSEPDLPLLSEVHPYTPGPPDTFSLGEIPVDVHDPGNARDRGLHALTPDQFQVEVGGRTAEVLAATQRDARYRLQVKFPPQPAAGTYPISVRVGDATTTIPGGVSHATLRPQVLLAVDTSTSMTLPSGGPRLNALKRASRNLVDALSSDASLGLIEHFGNGIEPDDDAFVAVPMAVLDDTHRNRIHVAIQALASGAARTSGFGDALRIARTEFTARAEPRQARHVVLVADGSEGDDDRWVDLEAATRAAGIAVHTVALGPQSDQPLLDRIARATGGEYHYVDVGATVDEAELGDVFARVADAILRRHRIAQETAVVISESTPTTLRVYVPPSDVQPEPGSLQFNLFGVGAGADTLGTVRVFDPQGVERIDGVDGARVRRHASWLTHLDRTQAGEWTIVASGAPGSGSTPHGMLLSRDDGRQTAMRVQVRRDAGDPSAIEDVLTGDSVVVQVGLLYPAVQKIREAGARVRHPDGSLQAVALNDDGELGDALAGDQVWSGRYRRLTAAAPTGFPDTPGSPGVRGSYALDVIATVVSSPATPAAKGPLQENVSFNYGKVSWSALDDGVLPDGDGDLMPTRYEQRQTCLDPAQPDGSLDVDLDARASLLEFQDGTDPCDPDTDDGGETDGSERSAGRSALDPGDDALCRIDVAQIESPELEHEEFELPPLNALKLRFSTCARNTQIEVRRGLSADGPWPVVALIDPRVDRGTWWDRNLTAGTAYWYQLAARNGSSVGTPSAIFSATAKVDPEQPLGSLIINEGRPRTADARLRLALSLYNKFQATTQMRIAVDGAAVGPWQPFASTWEIDTAPVSEPTDRTVAVEFRDVELGVSSPLVDSIRLYPSASLGSIALRLLAPDTLVPQRGALVWLLGQETEATALTDAEGLAVLLDLKPGDYAIGIDLPDGSHAQRPIRVLAGGVVDLGDVSLDSLDDVFDDGFESDP